jgi:hypothetical protein
LASIVINSNPKSPLFLKLEENGKLNSKLEENEELKSILLAETHGLMIKESDKKNQTSLTI